MRVNNIVVSTKAYAVNGSVVHKLYRKIPYDELLALLRKDEMAFLEHPDGSRLKRQTVHRASRSLSGTLGKTVKYCEAVMQVGDRNIEGFLLEISNE